jgi:transcription elongation GreA/GreB family factor
MTQPTIPSSARRTLKRRLDELDQQLPALEAVARRSDDPIVQARLESTRAERDRLSSVLATSIPPANVPHDPDVVEVGDTVTVQAERGPGPETYTITDDLGATLDESLISSETPMAKALLLHRVGDREIEVHAPGGSRRYTVLKIERKE